MTITSGPFEDQDSTEAQFAELFQELGTGVRGTVDGTDLEVTADADGLNVDVAAGFAIVRGTFFKSTAAEVLTITTAAASPRIDTVVLRRDETANAVVMEVKKGTAAATPVAPTLVTTNDGYEFPLANVAVAGSAVTINPGDVTDLRDWLAPAIWDGTDWAYGLEASDIPSLDASKVATGTLADARIPSLAASKVTSGTFDAARIPSLDASKIATGTVSASRLPADGYDARRIDGTNIGVYATGAPTSPGSGATGDLAVVQSGTNKGMYHCTSVNGSGVPTWEKIAGV